MKALSETPVYVEEHGDAHGFRPEAGSAFIYAESGEDRSRHRSCWNGSCTDVMFAQIGKQSMSEFSIQIGSDSPFDCQLRSRRDLGRVVAGIGSRHVYLDITGLEHDVWAPLLRVILEARLELTVVYVEPSDYTPSRLPTEGQIFDLSERIRGIAPIPGYASLASVRATESWFVPLLGFEGPRMKYMLEQVQPLGDKVIPVIGVPGFRPEYPFHTYIGNRFPLLDSQSWRSVRYVIANCPFSLFYELHSIHEDREGEILRVAPIGTKPHAVGAVLYALAGLGPVELVYDHPVRKARRTGGAARLLAYHVSPLMEHFWTNR